MLRILLALMFCVLPDVNPLFKIIGTAWQYDIYIIYHNKAIGKATGYDEKLLCILSELKEGTVYMDVLLI